MLEYFFKIKIECPGSLRDTNLGVTLDRKPVPKNEEEAITMRYIQWKFRVYHHLEREAALQKNEREGFQSAAWYKRLFHRRRYRFVEVLLKNGRSVKGLISALERLEEEGTFAIYF